jgi:Zn-dependent protease
MSMPIIVGVVIVAIFSITSHEAAHGFAADRLGDSTARDAGRLTLNPIPHIDPFFTILLPLLLIVTGAPFIFGGAKPVPIDLSRLRHPRRDAALVGAAGPMANIAIALLLTLLFVVVKDATSPLGVDLQHIAVAGIFVNALLAVFNLIPIPPLDGSHVIKYVLPTSLAVRYQQVGRYGIVILLILLALPTSILGIWMRPAFMFGGVLMRWANPYSLPSLDQWLT